MPEGLAAGDIDSLIQAAEDRAKAASSALTVIEDHVRSDWESHQAGTAASERQVQQPSQNSSRIPHMDGLASRHTPDAPPEAAIVVDDATDSPVAKRRALFRVHFFFE